MMLARTEKGHAANIATLRKRKRLEAPRIRQLQPEGGEHIWSTQTI